MRAVRLFIAGLLLSVLTLTVTSSSPAHAVMWCGAQQARARKPYFDNGQWVAILGCGEASNAFGVFQDIAHVDLITRTKFGVLIWCSTSYRAQPSFWCQSLSPGKGKVLHTRVVTTDGRTYESAGVRTFEWHAR